LQHQLKAARVTSQGVAKRKLRKGYAVALNSRFRKAEENVGVLAIIRFGEHSGAIAETSFDADVVMCGPFSAQSAIAEPAKHLAQNLEIGNIVQRRRRTFQFLSMAQPSAARGETSVSPVTLLCSSRKPPVNASLRRSLVQVSCA